MAPKTKPTTSSSRATVTEAQRGVSSAQEVLFPGIMPFRLSPLMEVHGTPNNKMSFFGGEPVTQNTNRV